MQCRRGGKCARADGASACRQGLTSADRAFEDALEEAFRAGPAGKSVAVIVTKCEAGWLGKRLCSRRSVASQNARDGDRSTRFALGRRRGGLLRRGRLTPASGT